MAPQISRRDLISRGAALGLSVPTLGALLAACGGGGGSSRSVSFLNWPLYIEDDDPDTSPTLKAFTKATGIAMDYRAEFDDNGAVYLKFQPDLSRGRGVGFDLMTPTSWMAARMIREELVQPFDLSRIPNAKNLRPDLASPDWDPSRKFSLPYAQGQSGIAYFPGKTGRPLTSAADLLDPAFKNRVTLLSEWRDSVGLFLLDSGVDPTKATVAEVKASIETIRQARDAGQFRKIVGNSYVNDLITGEVWAAVAWSGDVASLKSADTPDIEFLLPERGAMSFVDNLVIPVGAEHKAEAEEFINFLYDPAVSGPLFEKITYVSPVTGAAASMSAEAQANPFINPPANARLYEFRSFSPAEEEELEGLFAEATQL